MFAILWNMVAAEGEKKKFSDNLLSTSVAHKYVVILAKLNTMKNTSDILRHTPLNYTFNRFNIIQGKLYSESMCGCVRGHNRKHRIQEIRNLNVPSVTYTYNGTKGA